MATDTAPGTELLIYDGNNESHKNLQTTGKDDIRIILVPQPSLTDPNDPLRWPAWKKWVVGLTELFSLRTSPHQCSGVFPRPCVQFLRKHCWTYYVWRYFPNTPQLRMIFDINNTRHGSTGRILFHSHHQVVLGCWHLSSDVWCFNNVFHGSYSGITHSDQH